MQKIQIIGIQKIKGTENNTAPQGAKPSMFIPIPTSDITNAAEAARIRAEQEAKQKAAEAAARKKAEEERLARERKKQACREREEQEERKSQTEYEKLINELREKVMNGDVEAAVKLRVYYDGPEDEYIKAAIEICSEPTNLFEVTRIAEEIL